MPNPRRIQSLYLIGQYRGKASVIEYDKRDGDITMHGAFNIMTTVNAYAMVPLSGDLFLCGDYQSDNPSDDDFEYRAVFGRLSDSSKKLLWMSTLSGGHPLSLQGGYYAYDRCVGISYDSSQDSLVVVLESKSKELRANWQQNDETDTVLVLLDGDGRT